MLDVLFVGGSLALLFCLGYPLACLFPGDTVRRRVLAAPVLGYGVFGVLITLFYRYGLAPRWGLVVMLGLAAGVFLLGLVRPWWRQGGFKGTPDRRAISLGVILAMVVVVALLPAWLGGPQFTAFQGNHWDQISYIAYSSAMRMHSFAALQALTPATAPDNDYLILAQSQLVARPSVGLAYAALATLFRTLSADGSYAYMVLMQVLMFCASAFVLINLIRAREAVCGVLAAALTLGFFMQYVFDINAWSQLAAMPLVLVLLSVLVLAVEAPPAGRSAGQTLGQGLIAFLRPVSLAAVLLTAVLYYYPEILFAYGPPLALLGAVILVTSRFSGFVLLRLVGLVAAAGLAVAACVPLWAGTLGHVIGQISVATTASADWWHYFQRYLFGSDVDYFTVFDPFTLSKSTAYALFSLPVDFVVSAIGFYYLLPTAEVEPWLAFGWKAGLLLLLVALFAAAFATVGAAWRRGITARDSRLLIGALLILIMPVSFLLYGKYWAAGKALAMATPLVFILLAAPVLGGSGHRWWHGIAWLFVLGHLGFGLYRPVAVALAPDGIPYAYPPYPDAQDARFKTELSWDLRPWKGVLATCRRTGLDVDNPFFERYLQVTLSELGLDWSSARQPPNSAPDCLVTTRLDHVRPWQTVIWLGRNPAPWDFYRGLRSDLDLLTAGPAANAQGLWTVEPMADGILRWTDGAAEITLANNPELPLSRLDLALWALRPPGGAHLRLSVNGAVLFDDAVPDQAWSVSLPLDRVATAARLTIRIESNSFRAGNDIRGLGLPLRHLTLVRDKALPTSAQGRPAL